MNWSIDDARRTYNLPYWSGGYFDIDAQGRVAVEPNPDQPGNSIDLASLTDDIHRAGLSLPVLVRFNGILHHRVRSQCQAFAKARADRGYSGGYTAVYPIKVNQQRSVVEEILHGGGDCVGLEAGSKPELMAVLAMSRPGGTIICNGYKDREYIRLALIGLRLGRRVHIVIEKRSELERVLDESERLGIRPLLGVRVRLATLGAGHWQNTGGEKSKFGLSAGQMLEAIRTLDDVGMLDCLQLLHFHMGSQLGNIRDIQRGLREAGRYYAQLHRLGAPIANVDVGGGLGVDYEGTRSRGACSINYTLQEYASNVVQALADICREENLPEPNIVTESGRALTAHHAVLITNVIDTEPVSEAQPPKPDPEAPQILHDLSANLRHLSARSAVEAYHDCAHWMSEARERFTHGLLDLEHLAQAENLYFATCQAIRPLLQASNRAQREVLDELDEKLADKYFCNLSVFQSMPDVWAIRQIFPILPLSRLNERPDRVAILKDLTCDSDGRIDQYVAEDGVQTNLPIHSTRPGEPYLIGIFLVGAYQEILGDMHNLFGDTDAVNVECLAGGGYRLAEPEHGDRVDELLRYVHFRPDDLLRTFRNQLAESDLEPDRRRVYLSALEEGLTGYTYLED
ncbi:MAG: biosynthetic arginine decarboxylase [Chromatiales bacterium]|nr:biosynthetic arginine decarboxylase [Chromatiales bacterium]